MNHRKNVHPSNKKCVNFPKGECCWNKQCWYVHEEDMMDVDDSFSNETKQNEIKCFICGEIFKTKDIFMKHKKKKHTADVQICEKFLKKNCVRTDESCWFQHCLEENDINNDISGCEEKQVFQKAQDQLYPPDLPQMMNLLKDMWSKMEMMQKESQIMTA